MDETRRLRPLWAIPVVALTVLLAPLAPTAGAVTNACPAVNVTGGAPCVPGDASYSGVAYMCRSGVTGNVWGIATFHDMRLCMDMLLIKQATVPSAGLAHIVDLDQHYRAAAEFMALASAFAQVYTVAFRAMGELVYNMIRPLACIFLVAELPEASQAVGGVGCAYADFALLESGY